MAELSVLAVGSGSDPLDQWKERGYRVVRLDIDPRTEPDIVGTMTALGEIGPFDAVYCSHSLEHLYPHQVPIALAEFYRVLKVGGVAVIAVPDLQDVPPTDDILPGSTLCGLHLYYGYGPMLEEFPYMAHHCGFVESTLKSALEHVGFEVQTKRLIEYNLLAIGTKRE